MSDRERVVLDEMETPSGLIELFASRSGETVLIGVGWKAGGLIAGIKLGSGTVEHQIEAVTIVDNDVAIAFGGLAPNIDRAEVRSDGGETLDASIHLLPQEFGTDYRAVWGPADRWGQRCEIVGYDRQGRIYGSTDPRVFGPEPSDRDRLTAIRVFADRAMRSHATARLRETADDRALTEAYMAIEANYLALLETPGFDTRSVLARRDRIVQSYLEHATTDAWEPGVCSFCGERPVVLWFEGPNFTTSLSSSADVRGEVAWLACRTCAGLVEADDREELARRGARRVRWRPDESSVLRMRQIQDRRFWSRRDSR